MSGIVSFVLVLCLLGICHASSDEFREELIFKTLKSGHIYGHFQFTTTWNITLNSQGSRHYNLFPRALGEIFETYSVKELHLTFTQGKWRHEKWGYPVNDAASGAELLVWFKSSVMNVDSTWYGLVNVLSGMFCASLNFMDVKSTVAPTMNFRQTGTTSDRYDQYFGKHVRYAVLADENVCTENLTPWKKLLPCGPQAGLSALINANKLFDASYHSLGIHFRHICMNEDCTRVGLELSQTLGVVFDPIINLGTNIKKPNWSFKRLFGRMISNTCPLASESKVFVDISDVNTKPHLLLQPSQIAKVSRNGADLKYAVYNISEFVSKDFGKAFNLEIKYPQGIVTDPQNSDALVTANRFQTGYGQVFGGIMCLIHNRHPSKHIRATYSEIIPHYLRMYFHTLKIESFKSEVGNVGDEGEEIKPLKIHYSPGHDSGRPYHLEISFELPANSVTRVSFQFEKQLLKWTDYPPDANHGFLVAPSVLSVLLPCAENATSTRDGKVSTSGAFNNETGSRDCFLKVYTEPLLITLSTPDFSMPYNVICLVCTVIAISFGSIHNLSTKQFCEFDPEKHKNKLIKIKDRFFKRRPTI